MHNRGTGAIAAQNLLSEGSAEPFRAIVAAAADGVIGIDGSQRIVIFNRAAETMFGYSAMEAIGQPLTLLLPKRVRAGHADKVGHFGASGGHARYMGDRSDSLKGLKSDGSEFSVAISILQLSTPDGPLLVAHVRDISDKVELLERQVHLATRDSLTGAFNRRAFLERAEAIHQRFEEGACGYALLMLDLDHFKAVNDSYGHAMGDAVLKDFSHLCDDTLRKGDIFARWGGEEFIALLPAAGIASAAAIAERIRLRSERRIVQIGEAGRLRQTVSIGVTAPAPIGESFDDVIKRADIALYAAKSEGRNRVESIDIGANPLMAESA